MFSIEHSSYSKKLEYAISVLNNQIESLKGTDFDSISDGTYTVNYMGLNFKVRREVELTKSYVKKVTVTVTFDNDSVSCSTCIFKK